MPQLAAQEVLAPLATLPEGLPVGKEDEEVLYSQHALCIVSEATNGSGGDAKLLMSKTSSNVRFLLRDEKTMRTVSNFFAVSVPREAKQCSEQKTEHFALQI